MLRQAIRGARRYQHVAPRSLSIPSLPPHRAFSVVTSHSINYGGPNDKVRFYEQNTPRSSKRRRVDPEAEDREDRKDAEGELSRLDQELRVLEEGPYSPDSPFMKGLSEEDRKVALEALRKHEAEKGGHDRRDVGLENVFDEELDDMLREEFEGLAVEEENWMSGKQKEKKPRHLPPREPFEVVLRDGGSHPYVDRFNDCLKQFANNRSNESLRQTLWKRYRRCKLAVPNFLESMPEDAVALLWDSQIHGESTRSTRPAHLQILAADGESVGRPVPTSHILAYIASLHHGGNTDHALDQWEAHQAQLCQRKEDIDAYWKLGVRLFAADGNPQRAQDIALAFLANDQSGQGRILVPVITAWAKQPGKEAEVKAWALYLQLRTSIVSDMTMEDYDRISIGLLKAGRLNLAIAVFKDIMVTGRDPSSDSTALYKAALGLAGNLRASSISENEVNKISLSALTILPRRFQNRFFYASWVKKLIGMGEVDSAALVIELMYERNVKPDSKHLNGIIAAWLREGSPTAREKAERLGWTMIQQRIDLARKRDPSTQSAEENNTPRPESTEKTPFARTPNFMKRDVPPGNIETFSILLVHYTRRGDEPTTQYLLECLEAARLQPNSYVMNHLLYAELRKQNIPALWHKYLTMSETITPDLETFACLWDCGKLQYDLSRTASADRFPSARSLYSEMMVWFSHLPPRARSTAQEEFSKDLYDQIIRCFALSKDLPGSLVALFSMCHLFGFFPDDATARILVLQVARLAGDPVGTSSRRLRRLSSTPKSKENIAQVRKLVDILGYRKAAALQAHGLSVESLEPVERCQYQLEVMADMLRVVMNRSVGDSGLVEEEIGRVAESMDVRGVDLGSALDWEGV